MMIAGQGHVVVGTTDTPCKNITMEPEPEEVQIQWLLKVRYEIIIISILQ